MRLIDADALIQSLEKKHAHWHELVSSENKEIEYAHQYAVNVIRNAPTAEPTGDLISREDAINAVAIAVLADKDEIEALEALPSADAVDSRPCKTCGYYNLGCPKGCDYSQHQLADTKDCTDFLLWLLEEIMDEVNWHWNAEADGEIIARKLKKLGLLEVKDGYYVRTVSAEAVHVVRCKECRWWQDDYMGTWCCRLSGVRGTNADDFCSWGEREEESEAEE